MPVEIYLIISGTIFGLVSILHMFRAMNNFPLILGTWDAPTTFSWVIGIITGSMSIYAFSLI